MNIAEQIESLATSRNDLHSELTNGPATDNAIALAEASLRVRFPRSFRAYLSEYAGGMLLGFNIVGIQTESSVVSIPEDALDSIKLIEDIVQANLSISNLPDGYLYICDDGGDTAFFLDTNLVDSNNESPMMAKDFASDPYRVADSFLEFLIKVSQGDL